MLSEQQGKVTSNLEPDKVHSNKDNTSEIRQTTCNDDGTSQEERTQHDIIKIDPSDITEKNNACAWGSNDFQRVTPSHCHTPEESALRSAAQQILGILFLKRFFR